MPATIDSIPYKPNAVEVTPPRGQPDLYRARSTAQGYVLRMLPAGLVHFDNEEEVGGSKDDDLAWQGFLRASLETSFSFLATESDIYITEDGEPIR